MLALETKYYFMYMKRYGTVWEVRREGERERDTHTERKGKNYDYYATTTIQNMYDRLRYATLGR